MISCRSVLWGFLFSLAVCVENIAGEEELNFRILRLVYSGENYKCSLVRSQQEMENSLKNAGSSESRISEVDVDWSKNIALLVTEEEGRIISVELFEKTLQYKVDKYKGFDPEEVRHPDGSVSITVGLQPLPRWALLVEISRLIEIEQYNCVRLS